MIVIRRPSNLRLLVQLRRSRENRLPFASRARYIRNLDNGAIPGGNSEHPRTPRVSEDKALTRVPRR